jgi:hypothetical protein
MAGSSYIAITVRYEPQADCARSLAWIAPELKDAGLVLIDDHPSDGLPTRTWAGYVDQRTFERFAAAWLPGRQDEEFTMGETNDPNDLVSYRRTFDGMDWEIDGFSPIVSVSVEVVGPMRAAVTHH